ncbi:MAG: hypothetical protein IPJ41_09065 [Phycisphaerales bacterium]|nr:hypothetical protein [Phycisphaerales bacterium]
MTWNLTRTVLCLAACAGTLVTPGAFAQQAPPPPPEQPTGLDASHLRDRLEKMLKQMEASTERIRSAITILDDGGAVGDAINQLGGPMMVRRFSENWERWNRQDEAPGQGMGQGPGGGMGRAGDEPRGPGGRGLGNGRPEWPGVEGPRAVSPDEIMAFLRENAPEYADRLQTARDEDPHRFDLFAQRLGPRVGEILSAKDHDQELADILTNDFRVGLMLVKAGGECVRARQANDDGALENARAKLRELAAEQVDLRLKRRELEVRRLEERLADLRKDVDQQRDKRATLIDELAERASQGAPPEAEDGERRRPRRGRD